MLLTGPISHTSTQYMLAVNIVMGKCHDVLMVICSVQAKDLDQHLMQQVFGQGSANKCNTFECREDGKSLKVN